MRISIITLFLFFQTIVTAQKPCDFDVNITDSIGTYKETKAELVYEKVFGNTSQLIFLSLASDNGTPVLKLQIIQKSIDFSTPKCIDKDSKIYFQLASGKIYTMINATEDRCDNLMYNESEKVNNRFLEAKFLFLKNDFEDLKNSSISMMRIKLASDTKDYIIPKELQSEKLGTKSQPERFFIDYFKCIEN